MPYLKWSSTDSHEIIKANLAWLSAFYDAVAPYAIGEAYQNFADPSLKDYLQQYYSSNLSRQQSIKAAVDPDLVFNFPQVIPPAD
jgi:FAD/FMN-containing dehydrogenase